MTKDVTSPGPLEPKARLASIVIVAAMVIWGLGSWAGGALGVPVRFAFLLDLACMAALIWSVVVMIQVWRARRKMEN